MGSSRKGENDVGDVQFPRMGSWGGRHRTFRKDFYGRQVEDHASKSAGTAAGLREGDEAQRKGRSLGLAQLGCFYKLGTKWSFWKKVGFWNLPLQGGVTSFSSCSCLVCSRLRCGGKMADCSESLPQEGCSLDNCACGMVSISARAQGPKSLMLSHFCPEILSSFLMLPGRRLSVQVLGILNKEFNGTPKGSGERAVY